MVYAYYVERTPGVHAASDGSGLLARRVLKHCPMLSPVLVADLRSDRSRIQCPLSNVQSSFGVSRHHEPSCGFPPGRSCSEIRGEEGRRHTGSRLTHFIRLA